LSKERKRKQKNKKKVQKNTKIKKNDLEQKKTKTKKDRKFEKKGNDIFSAQAVFGPMKAIMARTLKQTSSETGHYPISPD